MFKIGVISCVHGYDGSVVLRVFAEIKKLPEFVFLEMDGTFVPYKIEKYCSRGDNFVVDFDDISDRNEASEIIKRKVFIPKEEADDFVVIENNVKIKGFKIIDKKYGDLGFVVDVEPYPAHDCIVAKKNLNDEKYFLIPFVEDIVIKINEIEKIVETMIPDGLV